MLRGAWQDRPGVGQRGGIFDQDVAQLFQLLVKEARTMRCTAVPPRRSAGSGPMVTRALRVHAVLVAAHGGHY